MSYSSRAPDGPLSAAEARDRLGDIASRVESLGTATATDFAEVAEEVAGVMERIRHGSMRDPQGFSGTLRRFASLVRNTPTGGADARRAQETLAEAILDAREKIGEGGGVAAATRKFADEAAPLLGQSSTPQQGTGMAERFVECAVEGRRLGEHMERLRSAIDAGDLQRVRVQASHVAFHLGRQGACGLDVDHAMVAESVAAVIERMAAGDEMGAMSELDELSSEVK